MIPTTLSEIAADEHRRELRGRAAADRLARGSSNDRESVPARLRRLLGRASQPARTAHASVTIRVARAEDLPALRRVAELDEAPLPETPLLMAEVEGIPRAALALRSRASVSDPFHRTDSLIELLALRADQLGGQPGGGTAASPPRRAERLAMRPGDLPAA